MRRFAVLIALVSLLAVGLASCSSDSDRLTVYSGRTENLVGPLLEQFSEDTGIGIDVRYGQSADLALLIDEEGDRTPADVYISQSPGAVSFLDEAGRLGELPADVLEQVPETERPPDGSWVGLSARVRVLVYNTEEVDEADLPTSVLDLTDDRFAGDVAVAPENGSFQDFVTAMRSELGDEETAAWLEGMADNGSPVYANNTAIVEAVGRGEVPMGLVNHYYAYRALDEDPGLPVANHAFAPDDIGSIPLVTAASTLRGSGLEEGAQRLVSFLLSREAQEFFTGETFEYPLAAGVEPTDVLPPIDELTGRSVDVAELAGGLEATRELIASSGIED